jgi:ribosomal protein S18 acetylase RimI-like enzyme
MADVAAIAHINYTSWQETYLGIIDDAYLASISVEQCEKKWTSFFERPNTNKLLLVVEYEGSVVGYCCAGKASELFYGCEAEVYALYLLKRYQGRGFGKQLFLAAIKQLDERSYRSVCLYVLHDNITIDFYRSFKPDVEEIRNIKIGDREYEEAGLGWSSLHEFFK